MKYLFNAILAIVFIFMSMSLFCYAKTAQVDVAKVSAAKDQKIIINTQMTYMTIIPFHEQYGRQKVHALGTHQENYVLIDQNFVDENQQFSPRRMTTFFEKATFFNDKLQSWLH
ncbi:MAG: hypothetical protein ACSHW0_16720 [Thalassotalea sp.]